MRKKALLNFLTAFSMNAHVLSVIPISVFQVCLVYSAFLNFHENKVEKMKFCFV